MTRLIIGSRIVLRTHLKINCQALFRIVIGADVTQSFFVTRLLAGYWNVTCVRIYRNWSNRFCIIHIGVMAVLPLVTNMPIVEGRYTDIQIPATQWN
jgi:hypothetical protein